MLSENVTGDTADMIADLATKYIWWQPIGRRAHPIERVIAQVMNIGTYEDIRRLEDALGEDRLLGVMRDAEPGWFSARSWEFWRGRLSVLPGAEALPRTPPKRGFRRASPL